MTISSSIYVTVLVFAPFLMCKKGTLRLWSHLCLSLLVCLIASESWMRFGITLSLVLVPYFYRKFFTRKAPILILILLGFIYLNRYMWILNPLSIQPLNFGIVGLSYIVFRQIDTVFYEGDLRLMDYLSYVLSFYTLIAGPIERTEAFVSNLHNPSKPLSESELLESLHRIINGYLKIMLVSTLLKQHTDGFFNRGSWFLFALFNAMYIYINFSGYCDVVIGFARIARLELSENFNKPYLARNINDFWSRQHITLTHWITDYVFTPCVLKLDGLNVFSFKTIQYIAFFVTFLIAGVWHGSTVDYVIYGLFQAIGVCLTKLYLDTLKKKYKKKKHVMAFRSKPWVYALEWTLTQAVILVSFMFIGYEVIKKVGELG